MKPRTVCGVVKSKTDFFYKNKRDERLHSQCKQCYIDKRRKTYREHCLKYGSEYRARALERNRKLKILLKDRKRNYLASRACIKCGINDPGVLDFDHIDPNTKSFSVAKALHNIMNWEGLLKEIEKCQILCANCHRIKTSEQNNWYL